ncbi:CaiB/BaiF CoA-transferase family protein [Arthrobacter sp. W4I7]|uniref:CaiB/BaiF CoA transferase family protein n=1 Tax=Arthrobacter sp. W4I7 TaxID=3042296 RepID=UPI002786B9F9|nr:CaiB/BaiF CoA-transferase family protein [Arthrobacter sp. W4I7]MDQ0691376.1 alpha-methylacyl-CoA racemase [Arthrobacter sp. W4I7]
MSAPATSTATGPLAGVRVLEIGGIGPGPFAAMMLADMGADLLRIDRPGGGGLMGPENPRLNTLHRGRRSVVLDIRHPRGLKALLSLVETADVLLETFRPGVAERLGIGPTACHARNPDLVYARMTGWGQDGPLAHTAGHDLTYIARTGVLHAIGAPDAPVIPLNLVGDFGGGGAFAVIGIVSALYAVKCGAPGQVVDAAITDGTALLTTGIRQLMLTGDWSHRRGENLMDGGCPWYATYGTADGRHVAVAPLEPQFYGELLRLLDLEEIAPLDRDDRGTWPLIRTALAKAFASRDLEHWDALFSDSDACVAPVRTFAEAERDPQLLARGVLVEHDGILQPAPAPRFSATPAQIQGTPPATGADTREALTRWGLPDVDTLIADGIAQQA